MSEVRRLARRRSDDLAPSDPMQAIAVASYEPDADDPPGLLVDCPVCPATVGVWCAGFLDIHEERTAAIVGESGISPGGLPNPEA